ncbi:unnamed protein product, partial [Prorocentrum cordatum]
VFSLRKLSDHAMVELKLEPRSEAPKAEQAIPKFLFETSAYQKQIEILRAACELDSMTASEQWECAKRQMVLAAETTRNILLQTSIGDNTDDSLDAQAMAQRAVARAVWRQDRRLAGRLVANAATGQQRPSRP